MQTTRTEESPLTETDKLTNQGVDCLRRKQFQNAQLYFEQALVSDPENKFALNGLGLAHQARKIYPESLSCFEKALLSNSKAGSDREFEGKIWINKGMTFQMQKRLKDALHCYEHALKIDPLLYPALWNKGNVLYDLKQFKKAVVSYTLALSASPAPIDALNGLGLVYLSCNQPEEAIKFFKRALGYDEHFREALINLSHTYFKTCQYDLALEYAGKAVNQYPDDIDALFLKGTVHRALNQNAEADSCFKKGEALLIKQGDREGNPDIREENVAIETLPSFRRETASASSSPPPPLLSFLFSPVKNTDEESEFQPLLPAPPRSKSKR